MDITPAVRRVSQRTASLIASGKRIALLFGTIIVLTACAAAPTPRVRVMPLQDDHVVATDARQRVVTNSSIGSFSRPGLVDPTNIICTEPSPDVATALSTSLSGGLSKFGVGSVSLSREAVEGIAQLVERTASIQLLRDKMYQTCLAFANGAISGTTYTLIMNQLDRTIVTLLLGETAGGAFGRTGASLGGAAEGSARAEVSGNATAMADLDQATEKVRVAQKDLDDKRAKLVKEKADKGEACDAAKAKDPETAKTDANCVAIASASADAETAQGRVDALLKLLMATATTTTSGKAQTQSVQGIGGLTRAPTPALAEELRQIQDNFLSIDPTDSFLPACLVELGLHDDPSSVITRLIDEFMAELSEKEDAVENAARRKDALPDTRGWSALKPEERTTQLAAASSEVKTAEDSRNEVKNAMTRFLENPSALVDAYKDELGGELEATRAVFKAVLKRWEDGVSADETETSGKQSVDLSSVTAAMNLNRRSALARICTQELPTHLTWARKNAQSFRQQRLQRRMDVDAKLAEARIAETRGALMGQFQTSLKSCEAEAIPTAEKPTCRATVYGLAPNAGTMSPELLVQFQASLKICNADAIPAPERATCRSAVYSALTLLTTRRDLDNR